MGIRERRTKWMVFVDEGFIMARTAWWSKKTEKPWRAPAVKVRATFRCRMGSTVLSSLSDSKVGSSV